MPRTDNRPKRRIRFCGDCGYELAPGNEGRCPMCRRFEQLRVDFMVPRPSALAEQRTQSGEIHVSPTPDEWAPTVAEYRAILAERRAGSTSTDAPQGRVVRTAGLTHVHVPPAPGEANASDDEVIAPPVQHQRPVEEASSPSPKKAKGGRKAKGGGPRAPRRRKASLPAAEPDATQSSSAPPTAADRPATNSSEAALNRTEAQSDVAAEMEPVPVPPDVVGPFTQIGPVLRQEPRFRAEALRPSLVTVAILAASAIIGAAVSLLLS